MDKSENKFSDRKLCGKGMVIGVLYTIISQYDIFTKETKGENVGKYINISGGKVEYIFSGKNKVVKSLFSTDPKMYLDKRYVPGAKL